MLLVDLQLNWWNAQKLCRQQGIELGGIESKAEMDALHTLLVDRGIVSFPGL